MEGYVQYRYRTVATGVNVQIIGLAKSAHVKTEAHPRRHNWIKPVIKHSAKDQRGISNSQNFIENRNKASELNSSDAEPTWFLFKHIC
jgi:putative protein kinase ArgK-like GTPase of G3E family